MIFITVLVYVYKGMEDAFQEYESLVLPLLSAFNGQVHHRIRCEQDDALEMEEQVYEIHVLSFASADDFQNYLKDSRRMSLEKLRKKTIKRSVIMRGVKL